MNIETLDKFCDPYRENLRKPWSRNRFTYASNGAVLIRVPKVDSITDRIEAPKNAQTHFDNHFFARSKFVPLPTFSLSSVRIESAPSGPCIAFTIGDREFGERYMRLIAGLDGLMICERGTHPDPLSFKFNFNGGTGIGLLMPLADSK